MRLTPRSFFHRSFSIGGVAGLLSLMAVFTPAYVAVADAGDTTSPKSGSTDNAPPHAAPAGSVKAEVSGTPIDIQPVVSNHDEIVKLPELQINGLRERLDDRDKVRARKGWGPFLCLDHGELIEDLVFLCEYKADHPTEKVRIVMWETAANRYHDGIGNIAATRRLSSIAVYTSGDDLCGRGVWGDRIFAFLHANQISTLTDRQLMVEDKDLKGVFGNEIPNSISGDDDNLQVYYAEQKLKSIGATAFVIPATEKKWRTSNLMLIFSVGPSYYAFRPYYGVYKLSPEGIRQVGIKQFDLSNNN